MKLYWLLVALLLLPLAQADYFNPTGANFITDFARDFKGYQNNSQGGWSYQTLRPTLATMTYQSTPTQLWYDSTCPAAPAQGFFMNYSNPATANVVSLQPCSTANITANWTSNITGTIDVIGWYKDQGALYGGSVGLLITLNGVLNSYQVVGGSPGANSTINQSFGVNSGDNVTFRFWNIGDQTGDSGNVSISIYGQPTPPTVYYLTMEVYDEASLTSTAANVVLSNGSNTTTYTNLVNGTYPLSTVTTGSVSVTASASNYQTRISYATINASGTNQLIRIYLLNTTNATANCYYVSAAGSGLQGATMAFSLIQPDGSQIPVFSTVTASGGGTGNVYLQAARSYYYSLTASGYSTLAGTVYGTQYIVPNCAQFVMSGGGNSTVNTSASTYQKYFYLTPSGTIIYTNQTNAGLQITNFSLIAVSKFATLSRWGFNLTLDNGTTVFGNDSINPAGGILTNLWNTSQYKSALRRGYVTVFWVDGSGSGATNYSYSFVNATPYGLTSVFTDVCNNSGDWTFWGLIMIIIALALGTMVGGVFGGGLALLGIIAGVLMCVIPWYGALAGALAMAGLYFGRRVF